MYCKFKTIKSQIKNQKCLKKNAKHLRKDVRNIKSIVVFNHIFKAIFWTNSNS